MITNGDLLLDIRNLKKSYGETKALVGLDLQGKAGTVHTVFGENGSGKSTMVKILSGILEPDSGEIRLAGTPITRFEPRAVHLLGIVPVLQEILIAPNRSVLENIFLGYDGLFRWRLARERRPEVARAALARISRTRINLDSLAGALPLAQQQLVVIARALIRDPRILILDESTSALDIEDRNILFNAVRELVADGRLAIFISHRVDEVLELSDTVTVLHSGRTTATVPKQDLTASRLLELVSSASKVEEEIRVN